MPRTPSSTIAITRVRTGKGDGGETTLRGRQYRKHHSLIRYVGQLDIAQSHTTALPTAWGDSAPRSVAQELLFRLGSGAAGGDEDIAIAQITELMERQIEGLTSGLKPLDTFIIATKANDDAHRLRAFVRAAECGCVEAMDTLEAENPVDGRHPIFTTMALSAKALNVMADWVFAFIWCYSLAGENEVAEDARWRPWSDVEIRELNSG